MLLIYLWLISKNQDFLRFEKGEGGFTGALKRGRETRQRVWSLKNRRVETGRCDETSSTRLGSASWELGELQIRIPRACHRESGRVLFRLKRVLEDAPEWREPRSAREERIENPTLVLAPFLLARARDDLAKRRLESFRLAVLCSPAPSLASRSVQLREKGARWPRQAANLSRIITFRSRFFVLSIWEIQTEAKLSKIFQRNIPERQTHFDAIFRATITRERDFTIVPGIKRMSTFCTRARRNAKRMQSEYARLLIIDFRRTDVSAALYKVGQKFLPTYFFSFFS